MTSTAMDMPLHNTYYAHKEIFVLIIIVKNLLIIFMQAIIILEHHKEQFYTRKTKSSRVVTYCSLSPAKIGPISTNTSIKLTPTLTFISDISGQELVDMSSPPPPSCMF